MQCIEILTIDTHDFHKLTEKKQNSNAFSVFIYKLLRKLDYKFNVIAASEVLLLLQKTIYLKLQCINLSMEQKVHPLKLVVGSIKNNLIKMLVA